MKTKYHGVTKTKSGSFLVHIFLLGRPWHIKLCKNAEEAALWWDVATTRLNVFRRNKTVARAHLNFPDKIEEHMGNFEDDVYPGMRPRIGAIWHHLVELKSSKMRDAKEDKPRWNRALEAIAGIQEDAANLATQTRMLENRLQALENKTP